MLKAGRLSVQSLADSFYNVGEDDITLPAAEKLHWVKKSARGCIGKSEKDLC